MQELDNQAIESSDVAAPEPITTEPAKEVVNDNAAESENEDKGGAEEVAQNKDDSEDELGDEPFPKKATRALERRNKKINKLRARVAELEAAQAQPSQGEQVNHMQPPEGLKEPQEDDFEDYAEYLEAKGEYKAELKYAEKMAQAEQNQVVQNQQQWVQERAKYVDERAAQAVESIPELQGLYQENQDIIEGYGDFTKMAFLEAEKPELAFYALAKEGRLEELDGLSPSRIAREIALAEIRGEKLAKSPPVSKAPAPIKKPQGGGTRSKTLDDMSPTELLNHLRKSKRK